MVHILVLILFILFHGTHGGTTCPDAWTAYQGSCYLFGHDQSLPFTEAQHFCEQHSSHLVHVDDVHESNFLHQFLVHFNSDTWWIGLTDTIVEGEWKWIDTDTRAEYLEWGNSEPGNTHGHPEEDCAVASRGHNFKWADVACSNKFQPICEINVVDGGEIIG